MLQRVKTGEERVEYSCFILLSLPRISLLNASNVSATRRSALEVESTLTF